MPDLHEPTLNFLVALLKDKHLHIDRTSNLRRRGRLTVELEHIERRIELEFRYGTNSTRSED